MGAVGGVLAGGAVVATVGPARAEDTARDPFAMPAGAGAVAGPSAAKTYLSYVVVDYLSFHNASPVTPPVLGPGYRSGDGDFLVAPLGLPVGARIREMSVWAYNASAFGATVVLTSVGLGGALSDDLVSVPIPAFTPISTETLVTVDETLDADHLYVLAMQCSTSSVGIHAVRIGYEQTGAYQPITPYRCFDSRLALGGRIAPNSSRSILASLAIDPATGANLSFDAIPSSARAVTFNLTAVQATGANYFAVTSGSVLSTSTAQILFNTSTPTVANGGTVELSNGLLRIHGGTGPGSAHCVIDITGYYI